MLQFSLQDLSCRSLAKADRLPDSHNLGFSEIYLISKVQHKNFCLQSEDEWRYFGHFIELAGGVRDSCPALSPQDSTPLSVHRDFSTPRLVLG